MEQRICETLQQFRKEHFYNQSQMAEAMGVSLLTYIHIEKGSKNLSLKTIEKISKLTGFGYSYIKEHL